MLIINADDFGRNCLATDRIVACCRQGSVTSMSAMVFMGDSPRAAELAREHKIDAGLHVNFTQEITSEIHNPLFREYHGRILGYLNRKKYNFLIYNPMLRNAFDYVFHAQLEEFERLYGKMPSHIDGHHHMHLCANMVIGALLSPGQKVRRNFTYARGERNLINRTYRAVLDKWLRRKHLTADYLFSLSESLKNGKLEGSLERAKTSTVELQTHPERREEFEWLTGNRCLQAFARLPKGTWAQWIVSAGKAKDS